jgi:peptidoglycan hydrolase-like protein with peptidoglycan-binding domain
MKKYIVFALVFVFALPSLTFAVTGSTSSSQASSGQVFTSTLQKGVSSADVSTLQTMLKTSPAIYPAGLVTGYYGPATETAVKKLQAKYSLPQTGVVDSATQAILYPNPYTTDVNITVMAPNGGESWTAGSVQKILWKSTISPMPISSEVPAPMPTPVMMNGTSASGVGGGSSGAVGANMIVSKKITTDAGVTAMPPFFNYASIDLTRDSNSSYAYHIGSVNLYESQYSWVVPKNIPEASDYRVRISLGNNVPCMYTNDVQMMKAGTAVSSAIARPVCATPMIASSFASDSSDNVFSIKGGSSVNAEALRAQIAEIKAMIEKLSARIAEIELKLEGM